MLFHHDGRPYEEAASEAATRARSILGSLIETGKTRAAGVIEAVQSQVPTDRIVKAGAMNFARLGGLKDALTVGWNGEPAQTINRHAVGQLAERAKMPARFVDHLAAQGDWGLDLLAHNFNQIVRRDENRRVLVRSVGDEVRGILSDSFRRLDSRPVLDAFCAAAAKIGALPIEGYVAETKVSIKAILPAIFEPVPNEVMAFGLNFSNSDFGDGALSIRVFMLRLWCTNYAITDEALRQIHLGGRLPDSISFSDATYRLDTERTSSMVNDVVLGELSPERVDQVCGVIRAANEQGVTPATIKGFLSKYVNKDEHVQIADAFSSADVVNLPPGQTAWRLSNAVSWVAGQTANESRKLDLMKVAALALPNGGALHADRN